jgi:hypothetical protein
MEFIEFRKRFQDHVANLLNDGDALFIADVAKDVLWETYLDSFPPGTNEIYRVRREMDCSCCKQFIRAFGNVVAIRDNAIITAWDFDTGDAKYAPMLRAMDALVKSAPIRDVFVTKQSAFGTDKSREMREDGTVHVWHHFRIELPKQYVSDSTQSESALMAAHRATHDVFKRSLEEISKSAIETILDLIVEESLYRGKEWAAALTKFLELHNEYQGLPDEEKENYCWAKSVEVGAAIGKIRNHSIGVLLQDITAGVDIIEAVRKYEHIVAPANYKRPKAIFTQRMVEDAQKKVTELGLLDSLGRRHAVLSDITINNVLWANRDAAKHMDGADSVFEILKQETTVDPKRYERVPGIGIDSFVEQLLPNASSLEVLVENRHEPNLMSLIAPQVANSPTLFKWDNAFSWAYNGNITDSMKQRVKAAGGNVEGILRFSLQWNDSYDNRNDYDAHCIEPNRNHIWFQNKGRKHPSSGMLDVDIIHPDPRQVAVENITWINFARMQEGKYQFYVHNYTHRGGRSGFDAEIEYGGQIYEYAYHKELAQDEKVIVAELEFNKRDGVKFIRSLPTTTSTKTVWGLQTNRFHPVSVFMFSPNYWDDQRGIGHRHYFFMIAGCLNDSQPNGFFNEYLREEFMEHKRVFEALGSKTRVARATNQLSGLGFSSTKRHSLICKVDDRMVKIIF